MIGLLLALALGNAAHVVVTSQSPMGVRAPALEGSYSGAIGGTGTMERTGSATWECSTGVCTAAAGTSRNSAYDGTLVEGAGNNYVRNSTSVTSADWWPWTTRTNDDPACPTFLGSSMESISTADAAEFARIDTGVGPVGLYVFYSFWISAPTGGGTQTKTIAPIPLSAEAASVECWRLDGGSCTVAGGNTWNPTVDVPVTDAPTRLFIKMTERNNVANGRMYIYGGQKDVSFGKVCITGIQISIGMTVADTYIPTTGGVATRSPERASMDNPGCPINTQSKWGVSTTIKPYGGQPWGSVNRTIWSAGTLGAANSVRQRTTTAGNLEFAYRNSTNALTTASGAHGLPTIPIEPVGNGKEIGSQYVLQTLAQRADGTTVAGGAGSAGTWDAAPAKIYFGSNSTLGNEVLYGFIRDWWCNPWELQ